ncbi:betaine-aldehyde dehydrogenase [Xylogone sp. PMI_703]|nr:betaine-aldehyde dehydrogenase [Xylogone sp. PMI_703]
MAATLPSTEASLPTHFDLFYGGTWCTPRQNEYKETYNPGNGQVIQRIAQATESDVDAAAEAAHAAFLKWRTTPPTERASLLRRAAERLRQHGNELALLDALNTGNPVAEMLADANVAAANLDYFAGLIPMLKGDTIPQSSDSFHYTVREPLGVVARIIAFNHPVMFAGSKLAAPLAAGNTVIIKPPDQAPLSCLRLAEILSDIFPPGVVSILPGGKTCGQALTTHPLVKKVTLIGSVTTGKAIQRAASSSLKPTLLELGGKNALIAFPDADIDKVVEGVARGMNFTWAGQSCGSTSRVFLHDSHHDAVLARVVSLVESMYRPGVPTEMATTMGPLINKAAQDRVMSYIDSARAEGARLLAGGGIPPASASTQGGFFVQPTIFADVTPHMRIAREEIFGPVMAVFRWKDEEQLLEQVNSTQYGLTASIYTRDLVTATRVAGRVEAGFIWVNQVSRHFLGVPFGGVKESGMGREESLEELLDFTQIKSINISLV